MVWNPVESRDFVEKEKLMEHVHFVDPEKSLPGKVMQFKCDRISSGHKFRKWRNGNY